MYVQFANADNKDIFSFNIYIYIYLSILLVCPLCLVKSIFLKWLFLTLSFIVNSNKLTFSHLGPSKLKHTVQILTFKHQM